MILLALSRVAADGGADVGGCVAGGIVDAYPGQVEPPAIIMRPERAGALLGIDVPTGEVGEIYLRGPNLSEFTYNNDDAKLPAMTEGQALVLADIEAKGHETQPPARYTEASLVKKMEEIGIGRPSTYASIIETIQYRKYVVNRGKALVPTWIAFVAIRLLEESFSDLVAYDFTAELESDLDRIAAGEAKGAAWLKEFYYGKGEEHPGLQYEAANLGPVDKQTLNSMELAGGHVLRIWPSGSYIEVDDPDAGPDAKRKVYLPDDMAPDELTALPKALRWMLSRKLGTTRLITPTRAPAMVPLWS